MAKLKVWIKRLIRSAGFGVYRITPTTDATDQLIVGMKHFGIDMILDVGANIGQFASGLRERGYKGALVSFEPLSRAHLALSQRAATDAKWKVAARCAVGDQAGVVEINISRNSVSSSLLPMMELHADAATESAYVGTESVPVERLDKLAGPYLKMSNAPFLKIDTQGFEWQVLDGAMGILPSVRGILCELSLVPLYGGQRLWLEIIERLESEGFTLWALQRGFTDQRDGRTLQVDAIFFRVDEVGRM